MEHKELVKINFKRELRKAKKFNYELLFNSVKQDFIEQNRHNIGLFVLLVNGEIDTIVENLIKEMRNNGDVDKMYIPMY